MLGLFTDLVIELTENPPTTLENNQVERRLLRAKRQPDSKLTFYFAESSDAQGLEQSVVAYLDRSPHVTVVSERSPKWIRPSDLLIKGAGGADVFQEAGQPMPVCTSPPNRTGTCFVPRDDGRGLHRDRDEARSLFTFLCTFVLSFRFRCSRDPRFLPGVT